MALPLLPTLDELLYPDRQPEDIRRRALSCTDPLDPIHLFNMTWRQPEGHVEHRVLPSALTGVDAPIVVMSGRKFPTGSHKCLDCFALQLFLHICRSWDKRLNVDRIRGWCNWVATEYEVRKCYSLEVAFKKIWKRSDWLKPQNANNWKTSVDWLSAERLDPKYAEDNVNFTHDSASQEVRSKAEKDALLLNARKRLSEIGEQPPDRLNP